MKRAPRDLNAGYTPVRTVRLSELFTKPNRSLVIYHFMYGKRQGSHAAKRQTVPTRAQGKRHIDQGCVYCSQGSFTWPPRPVNLPRRNS
jgi:predicted dithiol-disulfide oxidoreductase (DUF899 family)